MLRVLASAGVAGMQGAVPSPLIVAPGATGGFNCTPAGAGILTLLVLGITKIIRTQRLSLCDEVWTGPITWFPDLFAFPTTHIEAQLLCAEVRVGDGGGAVNIAVAPVGTATNIITRTVHLGGTPLTLIAGIT